MAPFEQRYCALCGPTCTRDVVHGICIPNSRESPTVACQEVRPFPSTSCDLPPAYEEVESPVYTRAGKSPSAYETGLVEVHQEPRRPTTREEMRLRPPRVLLETTTLQDQSTFSLQDSTPPGTQVEFMPHPQVEFMPRPQVEFMPRPQMTIFPRSQTTITPQVRSSSPPGMRLVITPQEELEDLPRTSRSQVNSSFQQQTGLPSREQLRAQLEELRATPMSRIEKRIHNCMDRMAALFARAREAVRTRKIKPPAEIRK